MFKTKKEVDAHVRTALSKIHTEKERRLRSLTIAKLYFKINEYSSAEQYLTSYLSVNADNDQAHKLLGRCFQGLNQPDKALEAFQASLQLNHKQPDLLAEVCQLFLESKNWNSDTSRHYCELAESEKVQHEAVFSLRLKLMNKDHLNTNQVEELLQKEISARPNDVQLRVRLVSNYIQKNQILDAFKYVHQLEMKQKDEFVTSSEWYNIVWLVLNKYEKMPNTKKDWDFWLLVAICLERQVQISFTTTVTSVIGGGVTEIANLLFNMDQYLFKIAQLSDKFCAQKELVEFFLDHYRGQFLLHASALLFKRELLQNKNKWKETTRAALPLLLLAYQIKVPDNMEPWMKHCDEQGKQLIVLWKREGYFRRVQAGRTLLSCVNDDSSVDKENAHNIHYLLGSQASGLWQNSDELLNQVRQTCSDRQWRYNIFASLFCNSDQKVKEQSSLFAKSSKLSEPVYELPAYADVEHYDYNAQFLRPQSLQHMVYLCLGNDNLGSVTAAYFSGLDYSTHNLSFCGAESLNQLDVDSFLYAATIQAKRALEVDREAFDGYQYGNNSAVGKPRILPFVNLVNILCSEEQSNWWHTAYMVTENLSNGENLAELRATLQYGIEAVRGINGPKMDMAIVFKLGQLLVARAQDTAVPRKTFLEARAEAIYKHGLNMMKMHNKGVLEPFRKYFKYYKPQSAVAERELCSNAEDAVSYLATRYFKKSRYEDLIEELTGVQLPFATYLQAEAYRKMDEASKTPKKTKRLYLDRATECLNQTLTLLKSCAHADPNHPLNSVIHSEIKRLQQNSARYLNDSNSSFSPLKGHNNSSNYEDAEEDFFADNLASLSNPSHNRRETLTNANSFIASHNQEMENLTKQITETLKLELSNVTKEMSAVKEKCSKLDSLKQELGNVTKEITALKERISSFEDTIKKIRVSSNPPSRDDASNVLDDLYLIEDTLQQQLYQQPQQNNAASHMAAQPYGNNANSPFLTQQQRLQAAAFNTPMFPPTHNFPMNFYGHPNQPNPYIMAQTAPVPSINQRAAGLPALPYLDPTVAVPQAGLNFNMPVTSTHLLPAPAAQPHPPQSVLPVEANKPSNLYNLLQQITPNIPTPPTIANFSNAPLTHTPISMSVPVTNTTPLNIITSAANLQIPKPLNAQPVEKAPPANVVITSSDPLPNPNTVAAQAHHQTPLSVTIPSHHIKPSHVSQPALELITPPNRALTSSTPATTFSNTFGTSFAAPTFSFKPQIAAAAAEANNSSISGTLTSEAMNKTAESLGSDFNRSATEEVEYDPRPDFKAIIPLPDEIEVRTGEENEEVMFCHRAKLFRHVDKEWKERGVGDIKILKNKDGSSRILMRRDQTHKICANHVITPELQLTVPKNETKGFIWAANDFADEALHLEKFFVRFKLPETALQFQEAFKNAQKEAKNKPSTTAADDNNRKAEEQKVKGSTTSTAPFSLAKSNITKFATSTPAQKSEDASAKPNIFGQPTSAATANATAATTSCTMPSKSLFGGLNLSIKSATTNESTNDKPVATAASPFANFMFGKPESSSISTSTTATPAVKTSTFTTNTASPFASIFSNLSSSPFANTANAVAPQEPNNLSALNKSAVSDAEDDYVPTAQFNPVIPLPDLVELNTGEENELVLFEHRAKLLRFDKEAGEWKERGLGNIKLLQDKDDINKVRLVMRREQIHKLCCNQRVHKDTSFKYAKNSKTAVSWAGQDFSENELITEMLTVRFKLPETCKEFLEAVQKAQSKMTNDGKELNSKAKDNSKQKAELAVKGFGEAFKPKAGSWSCEACYISNDAQQLYCVACDSPKDKTVPKKEHNSNVLATSSTTKFNFGFAASTAAASTTQTTSPAASKTDAPAAAVTGGFSDNTKPTAGSWNYQSSYLSNNDATKDNAVAKKEANANPEQKFSFGFGVSVANTTAVTTKPTEAKATAQTPAAVGFGDAFKPKAGSWTCQACYLSNTSGVVYCSACDAPKDDTVPKKEANANILALSNPTQKFSFGFGSAAATASGDSNKSAASAFSFNSPTLPTTSFGPPSATSTTLNTNSSKDNTTEPATTTPSTAIGKSSFTFSLSSKAMEAPALSGAGGEASANAFSLDKKEFNFTLKPKSPGKAGKSPMRFGGGDADAAGDADDGEDLQEEEENNTYFTPVIPLPDKIEVKTGEEDEDLLYVHRAKLYRFIDGEWKERGLGNVKILRHKDTKKLRVVMRREQILKICLNHVLNEDVEYKRKDDKSWLFMVNDFSEGAVELEKFSLRFKTPEMAEEFMETVKKALSGTAEVVKCDANTSVKANISAQTSTPASTSDLVISDEDRKTADKLKLPYEFFTAKPTCPGCRGCDSDNFVFTDTKNKEAFVSKDNTDNQLLIMELPALSLKKSLLKQSTLSPANLKTETTKVSDSIFSGAKTPSFPASNIATDKPANTTFSFTAALNSTGNSTADTKPFSAVASGGFLFGSGSMATSTKTSIGGSIFGGGNENKPIFGQTPKSLFSGALTNDVSNVAATKTIESTDAADEKTTPTSIFSSAGSTSANTVGSMFSGKPVFDSNIQTSTASFASNNSKTLFGGESSDTTKQSTTGGNSIFGSTNRAPFQFAFSDNPSFGGLYTPSSTASDFASLAKTNPKTSDFDFSKTATASLDFAALAKASPKMSTPSTTDKPGPGGFVGLTHNEDFSSFAKPQQQKGNESQKSIDGGEKEDGGNANDDNYDPHYEPIIELPEEIVITTGEEEETKLFGERAKLYRWDVDTKEWKERGVGELKILLHPAKQSYRLVMRREQIHKLVLNHGINADFVYTNMKNDPKSFVWGCLNYAESNEGVLEKLAVRFKNPELAEAFITKITDCIEICKQRAST